MDADVFSKFPIWRGQVPDGYAADFVGHLIKPEYQHGVAAIAKSNYSESKHLESNQTDSIKPNTPTIPVTIDDEIFEWIAVLESVLASKDSFTMVELGAGYGRWTGRAACALRLQYPSMPAHFIAVEAEPTHFAWMKEHFKINGIDPANYTLVQAPVTGRPETVPFTVGHASEWPSSHTFSKSWLW
ncbi:MAG: hypothetical protein J0H89_09460 [Rhizobiales bacterium]|nr:hypothetical protein [Hyphomicrobiales bacterium]